MSHTKENNNTSITTRFKQFNKQESAGGIYLIIVTVIALIWSNSAWSDSYFQLWHTHLKIGLGEWMMDYTLHHWINDGLMAIFFFMIGLEIKREVMHGELSSFKQSSLPIFGAVGGMLVPAAIYVAFNTGTNFLHGWGIPMATDIAFAIGALSLLGKRVPFSLKVFLVALAIVDDIGAVLVIAFFYTAELNFQALLIGLVLFGFLLLLNKMKVFKMRYYVIIGIVIWAAFLYSGVHATVAGILVAFAIPNRPKSRIEKRMSDNIMSLQALKNTNADDLQDHHKGKEMHHHISYLRNEFRSFIPPLMHFEHGLHGMVNFFIIPLFALANAGVVLDASLLDQFNSPVTLGVLLGLFVGKTFGISLLAWIAIKTGISSMPANVRWIQIIAVSMLGGIGFTMAIFITNLAFVDPNAIDLAKMGIIVGSLLSGVIGFQLLKIFSKEK
ncbi:MAG: Na+/H+ antiporter NhaA [Bacteroidetes bacterium HGW-Bacteroidetes-1]|jgi:NhaA family Na+:H+ antiporter|nr:MAG: Na+/H+ antiporter NhaA [Bacteroidetes bacterium HGW-Bacteroidetes-1]